MKKVALSLLVIAASGAYVWSQSGGVDSGPLLSGDALQTGSIGGDVPAPAVKAPFSGGHLFPAVLREESDENDGGDDDESAGTSLVTRPPAEARRVAAIPAPTAHPLPIAAPTAAPAPPAAPSPAPAFLPVPSFFEAAPAPAELVDAPTRIPRPRPGYETPIMDAGVTPVAMTRPRRTGYADGTFTGSPADAYYGTIQIQAIVQNGRLVNIKVLQYPSDRRTSVQINRQALPMLRDEVVQAQSANVDIISGATLTSEAFIRSIGSALRQAAQ